ncbi:hypothetical protein J6590_058051, partial [Homalodisca vitripennis]
MFAVRQYSTTGVTILINVDNSEETWCEAGIDEHKLGVAEVSKWGCQVIDAPAVICLPT